MVAVQKQSTDSEGNRLFDIKELEWFCQNAYNMGLKHAGDWNLRHVVQILTACTSLIRSFPGDIAAEMASDLSLRSIFCNFLVSSALVALARAEDNMEQQLQDYLVLRQRIAAADCEIERRLQSKNIDEASAQDLLSKLAQMLAFDFEAAVALKRYDDLREIVFKSTQCKSLNTFKTMADCALRSRLPSEGREPPSRHCVVNQTRLTARIALFSVVRMIINQIADLDDFDPARLAKYTRCLFQATLPFNEDLAGRLLDETCTMVRDAYGVGFSTNAHSFLKFLLEVLS